jgi:hypothetical protein
MKSVIAAFFIALMLSIGAMAQTTGSFTITGYPAKKYGVEGSMKQQFNDGVAKMTSALSRAENGELSIDVVGSADQTGPSEKNEDYGLERAQQVENNLLKALPKAHITPPITEGDEANSRMVIVSWKITSPAKPQAREKRLQGGAAFIICAIGAIVLAIVFIRKRGSSTSPPTIEIELVRYDLGDITYLVQIEKHEDGWHLPFKKIVGGKEDPNTFEVRPELRDARNCVKTCLKNPLHQPAIKKLIAEGKITATKKEKVL